jgi:hypothetical protein
MKQGKASREVYKPKVEPIPHKVSEAYTTQLGAATFYKKEEMYKGRGYKAPGCSVATHKGGSQGRH